MSDGLLSGPADDRVGEFPGADAEVRALGIDALDELPGLVELKEDHAREGQPLVGGMGRRNHRLSILPVLAQPRVATRGREEARLLAEVLGDEALGLGPRNGCHRVVKGNGCNPDKGDDHHAGADELPDGHAASAHDDEFGFTVEAQQGADAADHDGEGEQQFREGRQAQEPDPEQAAERKIDGAPRHAEEFDHVDHVDQGAADREGAEDHEDEALGDVPPQGPGAKHQPLRPAGWGARVKRPEMRSLRAALNAMRPRCNLEGALG